MKIQEGAGPVGNRFAMRNRVWDGGYVWRATTSGERVLVPNGAGLGTAVRKTWLKRWKSQDIPIHVYREFANLTESEEAIASFAGKYGDLHSSQPQIRTINGELASGGTLASWKLGIEDFRFWIGISDAIRERKSGALRKYVYSGERGLELHHPHGYFIVAGSEWEPIHFERGNVFKAARFALRDAVNTRLCEYPVRASLFQMNGGDERNDGSFEIGFMPQSLCAILWWQFAGALSGKFRLHKCEYSRCGRYFEQKRSTGRFCPDRNCRADNWNAKKDFIFAVAVR